MEKTVIRGKRVLLVDDQPSVRVACSVLLGIDDHTFTEAENGAKALDLFTKGQFDLVITDLEMPSMRGDELAVRIKQLVPSQPILMITAYRKELGDASNPVDAVLNKPFTLDEFRGAIAKLLPN